MTPRQPALKVGEVRVCSTCLRTSLDRTEVTAGRCRCGGRIIVMPRGEVEARLADRHGREG